MTSEQVVSARLGRVGWVVLVAMFLLAVLAGFRPLIGTLQTWVPALLVPPAAGLPSLWPPLRLAPLGQTTVASWLIDLAGVSVMLAVALIWLRTASRRHPHPGRGRAFGRGLGVTVLAVISGNIIRFVLQSFILQSDLGTYLGQLLATIMVSALTALLPGLIVGAATAIVGSGRRRPRR